MRLLLGGILLLGAGILRCILGDGEQEETRPTNSTNSTVPTTTAATAGNHAVPTTTTASNRNYSNDTSSSRRRAPTTTTTTAATASNRAVPTTTTTTAAATAGNRAIPTTTAASNRDYSPCNDTSSSRRCAPTTTTTTAATASNRAVPTTTTTTTAATAGNRAVPTTTTASNRDYSPCNDTSSSRRRAPTTTTTTAATASNRAVPTTTTTITAATASNRAVPTTTTVRNCDYSSYNDTSSRSHVPSVSTPLSPPASSSSGRTGIPLSSSKPLRPSSKPFLSLAPSNPTDPNSKTDYILVEKSTSLIYAIPEDIRDLIKKDVVPGILKRPLSPSTYRDYFEALLYAEDFYLEKWDGFEMKNVTLELHEAAIYKRKGKYNKNVDDEEKDDKVFVTFELDSIPERRPFLLSRDFVSVRPSGTNAEPFQGLIYRVVKSNRVLVDFGEEFHDQHYSACKYNVKFSFNRVCLKRAHQAIATASGPLFRNFLFPDSISKNSLTAQLQSINSNLNSKQVSAVRQILSHQNAIPYLVEGPVSVYKSIPNWSLSRTGFVVYEAVLQVYRTFPSCRILICAPTNNACDAITINLKENIQESDIFRANAAFREFNGVPEDILPSCHYEEERECFACPSLEELRKFKVISSTFMSSFRLHNEGIMAGHFSHIFLVDASSVIEPEAMVPLANLANESTAVTITGTPGNHSGWIRSHIARQNGLLVSYFERLRESKLYESLDPKLITQL